MEASKVKTAVIDVPQNSEKHAYPPKTRFWHIDKDMLPYKAHYFLMNAGLGAIISYQIVIGMEKLRLTAGNLAATITAQHFILILSNPGIGYLADYLNKLKAFIIGVTILQVISCFCLIIIPSEEIQALPQNISNSSFCDALTCNVCNILQEFYSVSELHNSNDNEMRRVLTCFDKSSDFFIECSKWNDLQLVNLNLYSIEKECAMSSRELIASAFSLGLYNESFSDMIHMTVLVNGSQNFRSVCFSTEHFSILKSITSHDLLKKYCRSIPKSETLRNEFQIAKHEVTNCSSFSQYSSLGDQSIPDTTFANFKTYRFWLFTVCFISSSIFINSLLTLSDTACYESVQGVNYGRQAFWGGVSWGIFSPLAGFVNDYTQGYFSSWILFVIVCFLQIWNAFKMRLEKSNASGKISKDVKEVFKSTEFLAFELGIFMHGFFTGLHSFLNWFLMTIGGNKLVVGISETIQCFLGEAPIMFISGWMIEKFGHFNLVSLALLSQSIRFFFYSFIHNPWWILPVECMHGFSYGSFVPAMTSYAKLNAKPGTEATTQAILYITFKAFGSGLGCIAAGYYFDNYGAHRTFYYASFLCVVATFINVAFTLFFCVKRKVST